MRTVGPTRVSPADGWVELSTSAVVLQNLGPGEVWASLGTAQPAADTRGIRLGTQTVNNSVGLLDDIENETVWVRAITTADLVVIEG